MTSPRPPRAETPPAGSPGPAGPALPLLLAFLALAGAVLFPFDGRVMESVRSLHEAAPPAWHAWRGFVPALLVVANGVFLIPASIGAWAAGRLCGSEALRRAGGALSLALIAGGLSVQALKHLFGRVRPNFGGHGEFVGPDVSHGPDSFPSGHAADAFCVAWVLWRLHPRLGWVAWPFAALVGIQRVEGIKHFPSDVAAGAILGIAVAELVLRRRTRGAIDRPPEGR